jgi:hypothetical protein
MAIITLNNNSLSSVTELPSGVGGKVLQVVMGTTGTLVTNNTNDWLDTGLSVTITPSSSSSKIYLAVSQAEVYALTSTIGVSLNLLRNGTSICVFANYVGYSSGDDFNGESCNFLDSPASTSALTYKIQFIPSGGNSQIKAQANNGVSTITAMEIAV